MCEQIGKTTKTDFTKNDAVFFDAVKAIKQYQRAQLNSDSAEISRLDNLYNGALAVIIAVLNGLNITQFFTVASLRSAVKFLGVKRKDTKGRDGYINLILDSLENLVNVQVENVQNVIKTEFNSIADNMDIYIKSVDWDLFNKSVNIFSRYKEKRLNIDKLPSGYYLNNVLEDFLPSIRVLMVFASIKDGDFWQIFAEITKIYSYGDYSCYANISAIAKFFGINLFKIYMFETGHKEVKETDEEFSKYKSKFDNIDSAFKFKICSILANIWQYYIAHNELHKSIDFINKPLRVDKFPEGKGWEKIARICSIVKEHEIFSEGVGLLSKVDETFLGDADINTVLNLINQYCSIASHYDKEKDGWAEQYNFYLRYEYNSENEPFIHFALKGAFCNDHPCNLTKMRDLCKNVLELDCKGLRSKQDYINTLERMVKSFEHPEQRKEKFNLYDLMDVEPKPVYHGTPDFGIIKPLDENYFNLVFDESKIKDVEKFKFNFALYRSLLPLIEEWNNNHNYNESEKIKDKISKIIGDDAYKCGLLPMLRLRGIHFYVDIDRLYIQDYRNIAKFLGLNTKGLKTKRDYFLLVQSVVYHDDYLIFLKKEKEFRGNCVIEMPINSTEITKPEIIEPEILEPAKPDNDDALKIIKSEPGVRVIEISGASLRKEDGLKNAFTTINKAYTELIDERKKNKVAMQA